MRQTNGFDAMTKTSVKVNFFGACLMLAGLFVVLAMGVYTIRRAWVLAGPTQCEGK